MENDFVFQLFFTNFFRVIRALAVVTIYYLMHTLAQYCPGSQYRSTAGSTFLLLFSPSAFLHGSYIVKCYPAKHSGTQYGQAQTKHIRQRLDKMEKTI
jgi:hypothetical protein